jgi:hypothetical protein
MLEPTQLLLEQVEQVGQAVIAEAMGEPVLFLEYIFQTLLLVVVVVVGKTQAFMVLMQLVAEEVIPIQQQG